MPAPFEQVSSRLAEVFNKWFEVCEKYSPVTRLLSVSLFKGGSPFLESRFLTVAQAIEGYCRMENNETLIERDAFLPIKKALRKFIPKEVQHRFRRAAIGRIGRMNELTLRHRIVSLFERNDSLKWFLSRGEEREPSFSDIETFARDVVNTRNGLTHVESGSKPPKVSYPIFWTLRSVLCAVLLAEIGVPIGERYQAVQNELGMFWWMNEGEF